MRLSGFNPSLSSPALAAFLHWWSEQLQSFLPEQLRQAWQVEREELQLHVLPDALRLFQTIDGKVVADLGTFGSNTEELQALVDTLRLHEHPDLRKVMVLPPLMAMQREVMMPAAVSSNLYQAMGYEIARLTPFQRDEVWYDCCRLEEVGERIRVKLSLIPQNMVQDIQKFFLEKGCLLHQARVGDEQALNLLPQALREPRRWRWHRHYFLILLALVLCGLMLLTPLALKRQHVIALDQQRVSLLGQSYGEDDLWFALQDQQQELAFFAEKYTYSFSRVLDELSRLMPKECWALGINLLRNGINLYGACNGDAAGIANQLATSPLFVNVRFTAPITQGNEQFQSFQIGLDLNLPFPAAEVGTNHEGTLQ